MRTLEALFAQADIRINGSRSWDMQINNPQFLKELLSGGSLTLGESYMRNFWDAESLDQFFYHLISAKLDEKIKFNLKFYFEFLKQNIINLQSKRRAFQIAEKHYDLGNDLFQAMLDKRMVYTCGYWRDAKNLDDAQEAKLKLTCEKLQLKPGMRVLDIGCGWGSFAKFAAENYGVNVVGISVSAEQIKLGQSLCQGLPIELRLQDYRDVNEPFDRIVSLGMFEHVGKKNYNAYMQVVYRCLKDNGLFLLHTIGNAITLSGADPWITKYIFPNGHIPSMCEIADAIEKKFIMEDWHNFGADYDNTLMAWHKNFIAHWDRLKNQYPIIFKRMWEYYLLSCAGAFRARSLQLWQILMSKGMLFGGVRSPR
ncbi:MAG TPA: cyclopropane fatty acyl phospholipid synthase [Coxiellaceae bacterium]|nr:MAG: cyclopropane-fatty-acyl-phospholipid synthase [Gammaproteobacteria bacterium RIFCSPHIGHO2_12_FULL_36_30]HLB57141.1 cyclopropane fatty acyl phospholipid synthase [Coxiellaceae bacterium]